MPADEINSVDWSAIPTPRLRIPQVGRSVPEWYELRSPARGLQDLATATSVPAVADAASSLGSSAILWEHMGAVFPAAVTAAPFLLAVLERDYRPARDAARGLLSGMLNSAPFPEFNRVPAADGSAPPLCCAIARLVRARSDTVLALGKPGRLMLEECDRHWRFRTTDVFVDSGDVIAFGYLDGTIPAPGAAGEAHMDGVITQLASVAPEYPVQGPGEEAMVRIEGAADENVCAPGTVIFPADCGNQVH
ncbi:hypothetical protein [Streptomyces sp. NPDC127038]|uniref:hypothetical protein n=1 Tax=Streptomyces sp. NPDC127038 TaxID=3347114 RepID=UPI00365A261A